MFLRLGFFLSFVLGVSNGWSAAQSFEEGNLRGSRSSTASLFEGAEFITRSFLRQVRLALEPEYYRSLAQQGVHFKKGGLLAAEKKAAELSKNRSFLIVTLEKIKFLEVLWGRKRERLPEGHKKLWRVQKKIATYQLLRERVEGKLNLLK